MQSLSVISASDLKQYFAFRSIKVMGIDWRASGSQIAKSTIAFISALPDETRTVVFTDAEAVAELAGDAGHLAMLDATLSRDDILQAFDRIESAEGRALWLYIHDPEAFRRAAWVCRFDQSRKGRDWNGFIAPAGGRLDLSDKRLSALANAYADAQQQRDGFRGAVASEKFERLQSYRDEKDSGSVTQITLYIEDRPQCHMAFEEEGLTRQHRRPARETHVTCCAADGAIDVVGKGGRSMRKRIAGLFAHHILGIEVDPNSIAMREIDLSVLADRSVLAKNVEGAIEEVDMKLVRFQPMDGEAHAKILLWRKHSIYDDFERGRLAIPGYEIDRVELAFTFFA